MATPLGFAGLWFAAGLLLLACEPRTEAATPTPSTATNLALRTPAASSTSRGSPAACPAGWATCEPGGDACGGSLQSRNHCGRCQHVCPPGSDCRAGRCTAGVVQVSAGGSHTCARRGDGQLLCWGLGGVGQLGPPETHLRPVPEPVALPRPVVGVTTGRYHTCVRHAPGSAACFGDGGLLGRDHPRPSVDLQAVMGLDDAIGLAAASNHTCALRRTGDLLCWGGNAGGQLGDDTRDFSMQPVTPPLTGVLQVAPGNAHTCAVRRDGRLWCWGLNRYGQLGDGGVQDRLGPAVVADLADVRQASAGEFHTCAVTRAERLYCWGRNDHGQLGLGADGHGRPASDTALALPLPLTGVSQVDAGERHTCAVQHGGQLSCWGDNDSGQLGLGDTLPRTRPTTVPLPGPVVQVSTGAAHTCALLRNGAVYCFGQGDGQLGDGTTRDRATPVQAIAPDTASR